jgi:E3 ubiquitin-protein ligase DOA10
MTNPSGQIRPTPVADFSKISDPGTRMRAIRDDIAAQRQAKQQQQAQTQTDHDPQIVAMRNEQIQAAEQSGNHSLSIALKGQLKQYLSSSYPTNMKGGTTP